MRAIFISYRREDAEGEAGRLFDDLVEAFGEHSVFMDVATIRPGLDFRKVIDDSVATCGVLLAVIGRDWLAAKDESGKPRLHSETDFVRLETASALKRDIPVIPVLVHGARMPRPEDLPETLRELAYRNGVEISGPRWRSDVQLLVNALRSHVGEAEAALATLIPTGSGGSAPQLQRTPTPPPKPEPTPPPLPPAPWWKRRAIAIAFAAVLVAAGALAYFLRPAPGLIHVPDLTGVTFTAAASQLQALDLTVGQKTLRADSTKAPDTVLEQSPAAGAHVKAGTAVDLVVSERPQQVSVPKVTGMSLGDAVVKLQDFHLAVGKRTTKEDAGKDPDTVIEQSPVTGVQVASGSAVDLVLSRQPQTKMVVVPSVVGISINDAREALQAQNLGVGKIGREARSDKPPNTVLQAIPGPGESVPSGSKIFLKVAFAAVASAKVPDVSGKALGEAREALRTAGLVQGKLTEQESSTAAAGTVLSQDPPAGRAVKGGSTVDLTMAVQPKVLPRVSFDAQSTPASISPGGEARITVTAKDPSGALVPGATVTIRSGGGSFADTAFATVTGTTDQNGVFRTTWRAPTTAANEYAMGVLVEKSGFQGNKGDLRVAISQPSPGQQTGKTIGGIAKSPRFAGTWELFEVTMNGKPGDFKKGLRLNITQDGSTVHVFNRDFTLTNNGYVRDQRFAADGHVVGTEAEADIVDTFTMVVKGDVLIYETTFLYKKASSKHAAGTDVRTLKYRRVSP